MSGLFAASIIEDVVAQLDAHGAELDEGTRREIIANSRLELASHPERDRLHTLWVLSHYERERLAGAPPFDATSLADEMESDEAAFLEMTNATLADDVPRCERAASNRVGRFGHPDAMAHLCSKLADAVRVGKRVASM